MIVQIMPGPYAHLVTHTAGFACAPNDHEFVRECLRYVPYRYRTATFKKYNYLARTKGSTAANAFLGDISQLGKESLVDPQATYDSMREHARLQARACARSIERCNSSEDILKYAQKTAQHCELSFHNGVTPEGAAKRITCEFWWYKHFNTIHFRFIERYAVAVNLVQRKNQVYVSDATVARIRQQSSRNADIISTLEAVSEHGDRVDLAILKKGSIANPANRRAELMARMAGFELFAKHNNHAALFITLTCPSRMHATISSTGRSNEKFDFTSPRQAQTYLRNVWALARSSLQRSEIRPYGIRVAEPQHDGTPHWHLLLFVEKKQVDDLLAILNHYTLLDSPSEKGAAEHRCKTVKIDYEKGTATGYVAKYISKNVDGAFLEVDTSGIKSADASERINAWSRLWRIRQFQQIGGPPVSIWRELRRTEPDTLHALIGEAARAADEADWQEFLILMGGTSQRRDELPIWLKKVWSDKPGNYGDPVGYQVIGLESASDSTITRDSEWTIVKKAP